MSKTELATIGGGCFWCLEAVYQRVKGVEKVVSGYAGGTGDMPDYWKIHVSSTGHAEVVQVTFDSSIITYRDVLEIFFVMHDPTTLNRQGYDVGEEYRSIILFHDDKQKETAEDIIKNYAPTIWKNPIVTELKPYKMFYPAEDDHQDFYNRNPGTGYCQVIIDPKISKLRQKFAAKLKD